MDLNVEVFGISFADFIKNFKKAYKLPDGTYDYIEFLKEADCASYCGLISTYKNPNEILNQLITPSFNNLKLVGGKTMKGGQNHIIFLIIAFMYILTVSTVLGGPAYEAHKSKYGDNFINKPKEPSNRFFGMFNPSQKAIDNYNKGYQEYTDFQISKHLMLEEGEIETKTELAKAETQRLGAEKELTQAEEELTQAKTAESQVRNAQDWSELAFSQAVVIGELKSQVQMFKGIGIGLGIAGLIYMFTRYNNEPNFARINNIQGRREIDNQGRRELGYGGKKTRKHRKKRTKRTNRTNRRK